MRPLQYRKHFFLKNCFSCACILILTTSSGVTVWKERVTIYTSCIILLCNGNILLTNERGSQCSCPGWQHQLTWCDLHISHSLHVLRQQQTPRKWCCKQNTLLVVLALRPQHTWRTGRWVVIKRRPTMKISQNHSFTGLCFSISFCRQSIHKRGILHYIRGHGFRKIQFLSDYIQVRNSRDVANVHDLIYPLSLSSSVPLVNLFRSSMHWLPLQQELLP